MPTASRVTFGFPRPKGASRSSSSQSPSVSSSPRTTASTIVTGVSSSRVSAPAACSAKASAKASTFSGAIESPAAARCPPQRPSRCEQAPSAPWRSKAETERPEPTQSSPGSPPAMRTTGRWKRSTSRDATIPITPRCHSSPAMT